MKGFLGPAIELYSLFFSFFLRFLSPQTTFSYLLYTLNALLVSAIDHLKHDRFSS